MRTERADVLRLIARLNIGGPARQAYLLTSALADEFPTVLAAGTPQPGEGELIDPDVPVTRVPLVRPVRPHRDLQGLIAVRRLIRRTGARLLHTHTAKAGTVGRLAALSTKPRPVTVHTFHGHVLDGYFSAPVERAFIQAERWLARRTDALIAVSDEVRAALLDLGIGRPDNFHVIRLGFDLEDFLEVSGHSHKLRAALDLDDRTQLIGVLGRLAPIKDHASLIEAVATLDGVHLAVLGDGELRSELVSQVRSLGIADRVHFVGWWEDVAGAVADLDVVALTSRNEGSPVSLIEALACGRAVVATDVGGVSSVVQHGVSGLLCAPGDVPGIARSLTTVLSDGDAAVRMGAAGRLFVTERFGSRRLVSEIRELYRSLLEQRA